MTAAAPDHRPETRLARLTRWVPTPRRAWRWAKRYPKAAAFVAAVLLALGGLVWPHARAAWVGHRLRYAGHGVTFGHYLPETARRWAPLPTDSFLWKTPVGVSYRGGLHGQESVSAWLDRVDSLLHVSFVGFDTAYLTAEDGRRAAAMHSDPVVILEDSHLDPGVLASFARLPNTTKLSVTGTALEPGELAPLAGAVRLEGVNVRSCWGVRGQFVPLGGHAALQWVLAGGTSFGDADLAALAGCPALVRLNADRTDVTDAGLAAMNGAPGPYGLRLGNCRVTDAGLAAFGPHPRLTGLFLANTGVTDAGLVSLVRDCPNLSALDLAGTAVTGAGLSTLAGLPRLEYLDLTDAAVTAAAAGRFVAAAAADGRTVTVER